MKVRKDKDGDERAASFQDSRRKACRADAKTKDTLREKKEL